MRVRVAASIAELEAVAPAWSHLVAQMPGRCSCLRPEWILPWRRTLGRGARIRVGLCWQGSELVGVLPLQRAGVERLVGLGDVHTLEAEVVARPDAAGQVVPMLARWAASGAAVCTLRDVPVESATYDAIRGAAASAALLVEEEDRPPGHRIEVSGPFSAFAAQRSQSFRTAARQARSRARRHNITIARVRTMRGLDDALPALERISRASWQGQRGSGAFATPDVRAFYVQTAQAFAAAGDLDLYICSTAGTPVGYVLNVRSGPRVDSLKSEQDPADLAPGRQIAAALLEDAWNDGVRTVHLGTHFTRFKRDFGTRTEAYVTVRLHGTGVAGRLAHAAALARVAGNRLRGLHTRRCPPYLP